MQSVCHLKVIGDRPVPASASHGRLSLIRMLEKKWVNGTVLKYGFFESRGSRESSQFEDLVRRGFAQWKELGIGLKFVETDLSEADVRVGFVQGDGSWSYVGRDIFKADKSERTMNFGCDWLTLQHALRLFGWRSRRPGLARLVASSGGFPDRCALCLQMGYLKRL